MKRGMFLIMVCALMWIALTSVASAGGWAVVTLDAMPTNLVVNQPANIGMMIRQHGKTPWVYDDVRVRAFHSTGETFVTRAVMDERGHYAATLNFPRAGKWSWAVASGLMPEWQTMPELDVANSAQDEILLAQAAATKNSAPPIQAMPPTLLLLALGVVGFLGSGGGFVYWLRTRK